MFLFAVLMGLASGLLVDVARRLRGHLSLGDLVIPAILLHWGHACNFLMGYQLAFGLFVLGFAGVGGGIVAGRLHLAGLFALVAVQPGGFGLAVTVPFACVFLAAGIRTRPSLLVWPIAILAYSGWVAMTMPPSTGVIGKPGLFAGTACYLSIGVGPVVAQLGLTAWLLIGAAIACAGVVAMFCLRYWNRRIAIGLLCWFVAFGASALAVGYGRGEWALGYRFVTVSAIGLAMVWCVLGRWLGGFGIVLAIAIFGVNTRHALWYGKLCRNQIRQFEEDVKQSN